MRRPGWRGDLALMLAAFAVGTGLAGLFGADNLGIAISFGQMAFAVGAVYVLLRR